MTNDRIAATLDEIADLLEFQGANAFRVRAYRNGARVIRDLPEPIVSVLSDENRKLTSIDGIGKDLAQKIAVLVETGELPQLQKLHSEVPESVVELLRIPGLGPKKAAVLHKDLGVSSLAELEQACRQGRVRKMRGFGAKTEEQLLNGISIAAAANRRFLWYRADTIAQAIRLHLSSCPGIQQLELAGSYRRGRDTVGDLDVLVVAEQSKEVMDLFGEFDEVDSVIARGETKMAVRIRNGLQIDLRVVPPQSFGAALQYFTGSKDHNVQLRSRARQLGLKINEYGVFRIEDDGLETYIAGATEEEVYAAIGLPLFPPELREARREFEWAEGDGLPELIELQDIRGDLHSHTTATDGKATLEGMVQAARERGLGYLAITDHSQRVSMARGLNPERLLRQWSEIDRLNESLGGEFTVLKGIECDILERGGMDLPDEVLMQADWVLASIHYGQQQPKEQITRRVLEAIENPQVNAIAHPTGRLINKRQPYEIDLDQVFHAAKEYGKILELNASPKRLDLNEANCATAKKMGIPIVISTDAHSIGALDNMQYGILQARRGGLTKADVVNTRTVKQLMKLLN